MVWHVLIWADRMVRLGSKPNPGLVLRPQMKPLDQAQALHFRPEGWHRKQFSMKIYHRQFDDLSTVLQVPPFSRVVYLSVVSVLQLWILFQGFFHGPYTCEFADSLFLFQRR